MVVTANQFKYGLSHFATGVCVVTTKTDNNQNIAVTISSIASLSLEPQLMLFCLGKQALSLKSFQNGRYFAVSILSDRQQLVSEQFAFIHGEEKWQGIEIGYGQESGCAFIKGCLAYIECERHIEYDGGDHIIFTGRIINIVKLTNADPLIRYKSQYYSLTPIC